MELNEITEFLMTANNLATGARFSCQRSSELPDESWQCENYSGATVSVACYRMQFKQMQRANLEQEITDDEAIRIFLQ